MDTLSSKVIDMLKSECSFGSGINAYMKHILINLDGANANENLRELQTETTGLVEKHFPVREEILPFTVSKQDVTVLEFSILKSLPVE